MALDDEQKSVQGIKDPGARKAAYYREQREDAEKGAAKGDRASAMTAANVYKKKGNIDKTNYYATEGRYGKTAADVGGAINKGFSKLDKAEDAIIPFAAPEARGASMARGLIPKAASMVEGLSSRIGGELEGAANKARQFLGKAKPVAKKLEGGPRKVSGSTTKAISGGKATAKAEKASQPALKGGSAQKALPKPKNAMLEGKELKPAGKAASSPAKRETPNSMRYNPKSGQMVGKSPMRIQSDAIERRGRKAAMEDVAETNRKSAKSASPKKRAKAGG